MSLVSLNGCSAVKEFFQPVVYTCDCGETEAELRRYTEDYLLTVEDAGNLRQALKACQEAHLDASGQ